MSGSYRRALLVQGRVLWALSLQDVLSRHSESRLGYILELFSTGYRILFFWALRTFMGLTERQGLPAPVFLLMGFIPWFMFRSTVESCIKLSDQKNSLFTFPQISQLDILLSKFIVNWCTYIVLMLIYLGVFFSFGYDFKIKDSASVFAGLLGIGFLGFGLGMILACLLIYLPFLRTPVKLFMRILFFISGVFYSPDRFGPSVRDWAMWNPILNYIELIRGSFLHSSPSAEIRILYAVSMTLVLLALGLLLERHLRSRELPA